MLPIIYSGENYNLSENAVCLYKLMDFNQAFHAYNQIEGANCQTAFGKRMTQKEATVQAVTKIGLNQLREIDKSVFVELPQYYDMFLQRRNLLKSVETGNCHAL